MPAARHTVATSPPPGPPAPGPGPRRGVRWWPLWVLLMVAGAVWMSGLWRHLSLDALAAQHQALADFVARNLVLAALGFVTLYAVETALSLPGGLILTLAGGLLFGTWLGAALVAIGATLGAVAVFLVARSSLGSGLLARAVPWMERLRTGFQRDAFSYLLFLRLVPVFPFWLINLVPAAFDMDLRRYTLATAIGILPATIIYAGVGNGAGEVLAAGGDLDLGVIWQAEVLLPLLGLSLLALVPVLWRGWQRRHRAGDAAAPGSHR